MREETRASGSGAPGEGTGAGPTGASCPPSRDVLLQADVLDRLSRIEGQVRGIHKMVQDRRSCSDIIIQLAAVKAAVSQVSLTVLNCHLAEQIARDIQNGRDFRDSLSESMAIFRKFA